MNFLNIFCHTFGWIEVFQKVKRNFSHLEFAFTRWQWVPSWSQWSRILKPNQNCHSRGWPLSPRLSAPQGWRLRPQTKKSDCDETRWAVVFMADDGKDESSSHWASQIAEPWVDVQQKDRVFQKDLLSQMHFYYIFEIEVKFIRILKSAWWRFVINQF